MWCIAGESSITVPNWHERRSFLYFADISANPQGYNFFSPGHEGAVESFLNGGTYDRTK
jgi:hypothetical protein